MTAKAVFLFPKIPKLVLAPYIKKVISTYLLLTDLGVPILLWEFWLVDAAGQ